MNNNFKTPILFLIFNRPDTAERVFAEIKKNRPERLFIASDGPRENKEGEKEIVEKTRKMILDMIDWDCEVKTLFREKNLGWKVAVSSAIDWFFEQVEEGIILEDDCLPDQSFFGYCEELLEKYRDDERIMMISGDNFQKEDADMIESYYFSKNIHIWGWATWRRSWQKYDVNMKTYPEFKKQRKMQDIYKSLSLQEYFVSIFDAVFAGKIDTWDYQWEYAIWENNGLNVMPNINLISNIGFGINATHTKEVGDKFANMKTGSFKIIIHPLTIEQNKKVDESRIKEVVFPTLRSIVGQYFKIMYKNITWYR